MTRVCGCQDGLQPGPISLTEAVASSSRLMTAGRGSGSEREGPPHVLLPLFLWLWIQRCEDLAAVHLGRALGLTTAQAASSCLRTQRPHGGRHRAEEAVRGVDHRHCPVCHPGPQHCHHWEFPDASASALAAAC